MKTNAVGLPVLREMAGLYPGKGHLDKLGWKYDGPMQLF
jgi:hypothetical protein